ncbi:flagellar hook-associated protein FlgK [Aquincola sp. MAHUQ-54]|uniref:Flagellar hook-associated protein 1 n=1 Tax=Aquincola agrisoli TaxID=3119538 RepID=A0AAW9PZU1_9BURK
MGSALLSIGTRAMTANYAKLQTISNNISNANVAGYSRQDVMLETNKGHFSGAGFFGKGVNVVTVTRSQDKFLTAEAATTKSAAMMDLTRLSQLQALEKVFPTGEDGVGHAAGQFLNAMVDLASNPQDLSARQVALSRASELSARFANAGLQLDSLQAGVTADLKTSVGTVNEITANIARVNQEIAKVNGLGHSPNDLLDQRDQLVSQLSQFVQVTTLPAEDGTMGVFMAGGQRLVLGNQATPLQIAPDPMDASRSALGIVEAGGGLRMLQADSLTGGSISGLLKFQNQDLVNARTSLGQMAAAFSARVNEQQGLGLDLGNPPGAGVPIFSVGAPTAGPASTNAKDASGNYLAGVSLSVADATQLEASEYELQADPGNAGRFLLTRRSDGMVRSIANGDTVDGITVNVSGTPGANDRFLLQPVTRAANGMKTVLNDPKGIAAASPVAATANASNTGTATVDSLTVVSSSIDAARTATFAFGAANGAGVDYTWSLHDPATGTTTTGTGTWQSGQPIALNGFELELKGVPASGDSFTVAPTQFPAANNGNALALAALRDETMVGRRLDASGQPAGGTTITDAYANTMAGVGVAVQGANASAQISAGVADTLAQRLASTTGVNLDEEAAQLIQFQQSYQAAAKILQVAQQVFDTLLNAAGA